VNILFVGDIFGRPGREALAALLPGLKAEHRVNFTIANGENTAGGLGATPDTLREVLAAGVDLVTLGNHVWKKKEICSFLDEPRVHAIRPANFPPGAPGRGWAALSPQDDPSSPPLAVLNLQGRIFMDPLDCPFRCAEAVLPTLREQSPLIIVDFHAEATSEKEAMLRYLDGRVTAVIGTHTHVQTADEQVSAGGTAYISDVGMTGPTQGVIGMRADRVVAHFITRLPHSFQVAAGPAALRAVLIEADPESGRATSITRLSLPA
jgi:hypothetical protein